MKLSTRTRYGVRLMLALALEEGKGPVYLKDIARRQDISEKYLSQIIIPLKSAGLVNSFRGAHGGYILSRPAAKINLLEIVTALEGDIFLVDCTKSRGRCKRIAHCVTRDLWAMVSQAIVNTLNAQTLYDLVLKQQAKQVYYEI